MDTPHGTEHDPGMLYRHEPPSADGRADRYGRTPRIDLYAVATDQGGPSNRPGPPSYSSLQTFAAPAQIAQFLEHLESGSAVIRGAAGVDMSKDHKEVLTCPTPRPRLALSW